MSKKGKEREPYARWGVVFYEERDVVPALEWLADEIPDKVARELIKTIDAVVGGSNPPVHYQRNRWHSMKNKRVDMGDYWEARDEHDKRLYRLICRFDSAAEHSELAHPVLVILLGASKADRTELSDSEYEECKRRWASYNRTPRRCTAVEFPPIGLPESP